MPEQEKKNLLLTSDRSHSNNKPTPIAHDVIDLTFSQPVTEITAKSQTCSSSKHHSLLSDDDSEVEFEQSFVASTPCRRERNRKREYLHDKVLSSDCETDDVGNLAAKEQNRQPIERSVGDCQMTDEKLLSDDDNEMLNGAGNREYMDFPPLSPPFFMNDWEEVSPESPQRASPPPTGPDEEEMRTNDIQDFPLADGENSGYADHVPGTSTSAMTSTVREVSVSARPPVNDLSCLCLFCPMEVQIS